MSKKLINIIIFTVAGIACLLGLWFAIFFNNDTQELYDEVGILKSNNSEMLVDLESVTLDKLPTFIEKHQKVTDSLNVASKEVQLQKDILYTYISKLDELTEVTFPDFKKDYDSYSAILFAESNNAKKYTDGFNSVSDFSSLQSYIDQLNEEYALVKQDYLLNKEYVKSMNYMVKRVSDINEIVSESKKVNEFSTLQKDIKSSQSESSIFNITLMLFYLTFAFSIILVISFSLYHIIVNIKSSYKALMGVGAIVIALIIGFLIASPDLTPVALKVGIAPGAARWVEAGIYTFYFVFLAALASIVFTLIMNAVKKIK